MAYILKAIEMTLRLFVAHIISVVFSLFGTFAYESAKGENHSNFDLFRFVSEFLRIVIIVYLVIILISATWLAISPNTFEAFYSILSEPFSSSSTPIPTDSYSTYGGNWYLEKLVRNRKEFYEDMKLTLAQNGTAKTETAGTTQQGTWKMVNGTIEVNVEEQLFHLVGNGDMMITTGEPRMEFNRDPALRELEQILRQKVIDTSEDKGILAFGYADYDGNGSYEAFALMGRQYSDPSELEYNETATLWYVSEDYTMQCEKKCGSYPEESVLFFQDGKYVFRISEGNGGSGTLNRLWSVENGNPIRIAGGYSDYSQDLTNSISSNTYYADNIENMQQGEGDNWYAYPSYFDASINEDGHTWKRYYYHWNGSSMREYGGIEVPIEDIRRLSGGREALEQAEARGYIATKAFYRGNDIVNVNLQDQQWNKYLTFQWKNGKLILLDGELHSTDSIDKALDGSSGYYLAANTPEVADYPSGVPWIK